MLYLHAPTDARPQGKVPRTQDTGALLLNVLSRIGDVGSCEEALSLFHEALKYLDADTAVFMTQIRDDATRASLRTLWAGDPEWAADYASQCWFDHDPWLRYATHHAEPILASALTPFSADEEAFLAATERLGFASALIAPAPSCVGLSRVGVLCLGSRRTNHFEHGDLARTRVLARALSMELHRWQLNAMRTELLHRSRITDAEIELLRHETQGHSSKVIGAALQVEPKTIDCRFQRVNAKLGAPDRRTASRIALLYGLL